MSLQRKAGTMVPVLGLVLGLMLSAERPAHAAVLDFEGLDSTCDASNAPSGTVPLGYGGLNWTQYSASFNAVLDVGVECDDNYQSPSFYDNSYGAPSPTYAAFSLFGEVDAVKPVGTFNYGGAYFSSFATANDYAAFSAVSLAVQGYVPGDVIGSPTYSDAFDLSVDQYDYHAANWTGLSMLVFLTGDQLIADQPIFGTDLSFLMDNVDVTHNVEVEPVPEPASLFLLGTGVLGLAARARRRRSGRVVETV